MVQILDGKRIAQHTEQEIAAQIQKLKGRPPCLAVFLVGDDPASHVYVRNKIKACERVGIRSLHHTFPASLSAEDFYQKITACNEDPSVDGILVQLPLPSHYSAQKVKELISPEKDVDGLHPLNVGQLFLGEGDPLIACTPLGISRLLQSYDISIEGKETVVLGRSALVGKPMAALLLQNREGGNATVTVLHRKSRNMQQICQRADLLIVAAGVPRLVKGDWVKEGSIVIDVGIHPVPGGRPVGDVDFASVAPRCQAITPVPGGVGPMTIAMLLSNTWKAHEKQRVS